MTVPSKPLKELFLSALEVAPNDRAEWLDRECVGDAGLREQLTLMLAAHEAPHSLLDQPAAVEPGATIIQPITERPGTLIGRYKLLEQIGEGGFGVVFMAEQEEPVRRKVALKIIKPGMDTREVIARFEAERQALAIMDHLNIAKVLDAGATESGRPFFVMELVRGLPITDFCDQNSLTTRERLELFASVCQAVQHAHQKGIIHRDIKPSNVMVTLRDDRPIPKVIDFGVAKATNARLTEQTLFTRLGQMVGTPLYMSPEQAGKSELDIDTRSDIYSLGILLYELLTGVTPFDQQRVREAAYDELLKIIREEEPPKPSLRISTLGDTLPSVAAHRKLEPKKLTALVRGELDWIVMKALEKDRTRRYETANGFAADIQRYLSDEPVEACPPSATYRFKKFARRNKATIATTAIVAASLIVGIVGTTSQAIRATSERDRAAVSEMKAKTESKRAEESKREALKQAARAENEESVARRNLHQTRIHLAEVELLRGCYGSALELLDADRPDPGQEDLHGFAWRHLCSRVNEGLIRAFDGHTGSVCSVAISPDGALLASANHDGTVEICDLTTGKEVRTLRGHSDRVRSVAFSADGTLIASAGDDADVIVWEAATGREQHRLKEHPDAVLAVAFAPVGQLMASQGRDGTIRLWDASTGKLRSTLTENAFPMLRFSPDGELLATSGKGETGKSETLNLWEVKTGKIRRRLHIWLGFEDVDFSPDGELLVAACGQRQIVIWDVRTGQRVGSSPELTGFPNSVALNPDGRSLAVGFRDGTVMYCDMLSGRSRRFAHRGLIPSVAFFPDGSTLASAGVDGSIKLWKATWPPEAAHPPVNPDNVWAVAFSPDGKTLAAGENKGILLRDVATGESKAELRTGSVIGLAFSPDGKLLASCGSDKAVTLWDLQRQESLGVIHRESHPMYAVAFSPDGRILAAAGKAGTITLWNVETRATLGTIQSRGWVWSLAFSPDGEVLASGGLYGHGVRLWDWANRKELPVNMKALGPVAFSPDGSTLAGQWFTGLKLWNRQTKQIRTIGERTDLLFVSHSRSAFFPDGQTLAMVRNGHVTLWDVATGRELPMIRTFPHWVFSVAVSPDGQTLATGGSDGTVQLWHAAIDPGGFACAPSLHPGPDRPAVQVSPELAVQLYSTALVRNPQWQAGYEGRAATHAELGHFDQAAADFAKAKGLSADGRWDDQSPLFARLIACDARVFRTLASEHVELWLTRGRHYARRGQWEPAVADYGRGIKSAEPNFTYACLLLLAGHQVEYHRLCQALDQQFLDTKTGFEAYALARTCALGPESGVDPARILQWAEAGVADKRDKFRLLALGAASYRAGQFQQAVECLEEVLREHEGHASNLAFLLALSYHGLGQHEKSQEWHHRGLDELQRATPQTPDAAALWSIDHWLNINVWHREAQAALESEQERSPPADDNGSAAEGTPKTNDQAREPAAALEPED